MASKLGETVQGATADPAATANGAVSQVDPGFSDVAGGRKPQTGEPVKKDEEKPSSLKIHIKLDLDVEVHLTARVKGDITIGLL